MTSQVQAPLSPQPDPSVSTGSVDTSRKLLMQQVANITQNLSEQNEDSVAGLDAIIAAINAKPSA